MHRRIPGEQARDAHEGRCVSLHPDFQGYRGCFEENMVINVESLIAER
jgi:hypothetical protein